MLQVEWRLCRKTKIGKLCRFFPSYHFSWSGTEMILKLTSTAMYNYTNELSGVFQ